MVPLTPTECKSHSYDLSACVCNRVCPGPEKPVLPKNACPTCGTNLWAELKGPGTTARCENSHRFIRCPMHGTENPIEDTRKAFCQPMDKCACVHTLLVTGSRRINDRAFVYDAMDKVGIRPRVLLHGGADGVDTLAGEWARARLNKYVDMNMDVEVCEPDKSKAKYDGDPEPYLARDREMVDRADRVVAIWDGESTGTKYTLDYAREKGKLHENTYILWTPPGVRRIEEFFRPAKRARTDTV